MTSFPRGSMTLTATRRCSPAGNGKEVVPLKFSKRSGSMTPFRARAILLQGFLVGKKGLGDAEGSAVVVGVNEPRRHPVAPFGGDHVVDGIVDINALHLDDVFVLVPRCDFCTWLAEHGEELTRGSLFEQAAHCHVGVDVCHVDTDSGIRIVTDSGLGGAVKTETRKDQIVVAAARCNR